MRPAPAYHPVAVNKKNASIIISRLVFLSDN